MQICYMFLPGLAASFKTTFSKKPLMSKSTFPSSIYLSMTSCTDPNANMVASCAFHQFSFPEAFAWSAYKNKTKAVLIFSFFL